ncbi:MAG: SpoIIE family protein phosphatase [Thermodesulfobacteriota bacterium]
MELNHGEEAHILVVDDDPGVLGLITDCLEEEGYRVTCAPGGGEALDLLAGGEFDLVVTDLMMPEVDGFQVLEVSTRARPDRPVIILTGYGTLDNTVRALQAGAYDFITKPLHNLSVFLIPVRRALEKRRLTQARQRYLERIESQNRALRQDLRAARRIKLNIMDRDLSEFGPVLDIAPRYLPAEQVGGDFFDVLAFGLEHVLFYMAHVAGQGVTAAMVTVFAKQTLGRLAETADPARPAGAGLRDILAEFNREILNQVFENRGAPITLTMFAGLYQPRTGRLACANAGHTPAGRLIHRDGSLTALDLPGAPLGLMPDPGFVEEAMILHPGERLFLCTDGLTEEVDDRNIPFGLTRLDETLAGQTRGSLDALADRVLERVSLFRGTRPQNDDISILILAPRGE